MLCSVMLLHVPQSSELDWSLSGSSWFHFCDWIILVVPHLAFPDFTFSALAFVTWILSVALRKSSNTHIYWLSSICYVLFHYLLVQLFSYSCLQMSIWSKELSWDYCIISHQLFFIWICILPCLFKPSYLIRYGSHFALLMVSYSFWFLLFLLPSSKILFVLGEALVLWFSARFILFIWIVWFAVFWWSNVAS